MSTEEWIILSNVAVCLATLALCGVTVVAAFVTFKAADRESQETVREALARPIPHLHKDHSPE